jgi:Zn-dependent protease
MDLGSYILILQASKIGLMDVEDLEFKFRSLNEGLSFILAILSLAVGYIRYFNSLYGFILPLIAAAIAIVPHEIAHRQSARYYGCNSKFSLSFIGFFITLFINLIAGIFIGNPLIFISGYTGITCRFFNISKKIDGIVSAVGPATNIIIALISLFLIKLSFLDNLLLLSFLIYLYNFNSFVAFFNLLPLSPLDGVKVLRWNIMAWIVLFLISILLIFY